MEGPLVPPAAIPQNGRDTFSDTEAVQNYLTEILYATLGASREEITSYGSFLSPEKEKDTLRKCTRFIQEPQVALYIQKTLQSKDLPKEINGIHETNGLAGARMSSYTLFSFVANIIKPQTFSDILYRLNLTFPRIV